MIKYQYGRADHDHLTRGLAYAVARHAGGLVVVAAEHRDEFKAVAQQLNDMAELDRDRGISVCLVGAKAVRTGDSPWASLFAAVIEPKTFAATVEHAKLAEKPGSLDEFYGQFSSADVRAASEAHGHRRRGGRLAAACPVMTRARANRPTRRNAFGCPGCRTPSTPMPAR